MNGFQQYLHLLFTVSINTRIDMHDAVDAGMIE
jgi:hypothetical protein